MECSNCIYAKPDKDGQYWCTNGIADLQGFPIDLYDELYAGQECEEKRYIAEEVYFNEYGGLKTDNIPDIDEVLDEIVEEQIEMRAREERREREKRIKTALDELEEFGKEMEALAASH